jgi:hypothetical protein
MKAIKQEELTNWTPQRKAQVKTWNDSNIARGAYHLEAAEERASQDMERKQASKCTHQLTTEGETSQDTEKSDRSRDTHFLEIREGRAHQDTDIKRPSERYSLSGAHRERNESGH